MRWNAFLALVLACLLSVQVTEAREPRKFSQVHWDGVVVFWPDLTDRSVFDQLLGRIAETGARHITIPIFGCQTDATSSDVGSCSIFDESIPIMQIERARANGFTATLLPIVLSLSSEWRGDFEPTDRAKWFETYTAWIQHVAQMAETYKAPAFIVASEFKKLFKYGDEWKKVIEAVRDDYSGPIVATGNWDFLDYTFWEETDAIGVSNYTPLTRSTSPSQDELNKGAIKNRDALLALAKKFKRPLYLTEMGYPSLPTAARQPWNYADSREEQINDNNLQAMCFESLRVAWSKNKELVHMGIWATGDYSSDWAQFSYDVIGKPAEENVKKFFETRNKLKRKQ